jgi:predicted  nucleic acid-binding Zn-ribbon protein
MAATMKQTFQQLWALQQIDSELKTLNDKLTQVPARINDLRAADQAIKSDLNSARDAIVEHKKQYKLAELELKAAEEKIGGYSVQLYSAKTNEQYKAFLKEIETQKKAKGGVEDRMIILMEETETLDRKVKANETKSVELDAETTRKIQLLEAEHRELEAAIATRQGQRATIAAALPADLVKRYERIKASKAGIAVSVVKRERCSACLSPVPAQRVLEIDLQNRVYNCEACGRILIVSQE